MPNNNSPTARIFSRQNLEDLPAMNGDRRKEALQAERGGYVLLPAENPDLVMMANGSEVALALHVAERLNAEGHRVQVASIPSLGVFQEQDEAYRNQVLLPDVPRFAVTAGLPAVFYPLMKGTAKWDAFGLERFGASAPYKVLEQKFGFTVDNVYDKVKAFLG